MRAVVGTVPFENFPLTVGEVTLSGQNLRIGGHTVPVNRGTPALLAATVKALEAIGNGTVTVFSSGTLAWARAAGGYMKPWSAILTDTNWRA